MHFHGAGGDAVRRNRRAGSLKSGGLSLRVFTPDELEDIHTATLEVLERTGVLVEDTEALDILDGVAAKIDKATRTVRFAPYLIEDALQTAPPSFVACGRTPDRDYLMGANRVGFTNFGEGIQIVDTYKWPHCVSLAGGRRRLGRHRRCARTTWMSMSAPWGPMRCPRRWRPCTMVDAILRNTTKHAFIGPLNGLCGQNDQAGRYHRRGFQQVARGAHRFDNHLPGEPAETGARVLRDYYRVRTLRHGLQHPQYGHGRGSIAGHSGRHTCHPQR